MPFLFFYKPVVASVLLSMADQLALQADATSPEVRING